MMSKINPKIDLVFKKLFGSEENKDILLSLINAILPIHQQIVEIMLKNPYNISDYAEGKLSILDIKAQDEHGVLYDIEMQIRGSDFYGRRTLFYWAKMFGSQLDYINDFPTATAQITELEKLANLEEQGKLGYSGLKKCIVISLMDFNFFADEKYNRYFMLKDGETNEIHKDLDYLDLYFIELKKYKLETVKTILERWITFLNNAYKYTKDNLPQELAEIKEIRKASLKLDTMFLDEKEKRYYESQQKFLLDENTRLKEAVEKAGIEATKREKIEIAKNAIAEGFDDKIISKLTGLIIVEVQELRIKWEKTS
jgi:PD-(D/E)XK nuclease family transposase